MKNQTNSLSGFILINKPKDWTSHDVVGYLRGVTKIKKIGHAGTLDPFATGLLIVGISRQATKRLDEFKALPKTYIATLKLGATTDTYDSTGKITPAPEHFSTKALPETKIKSVIESFIGKQKQVPPMYSAKKVKGKKLYELARKGIEIERQANDIEIFNIEILSPLEGGKGGVKNILKLKITCSTGTYIRTLAHDIGQKLDCGAYCDELERTAIGKYKLKNSIGPKELENDTYPQYLQKLE